MKILTSRTVKEFKFSQENQPQILVDMNSKRYPMPAKAKKSINRQLHALGNYHEEIPLDTIFNALEEFDITPLQEDGTKWSGMLIGGGECGSDASQEQYANFELAMWQPDGSHILLKNGLYLTWCTMPSGKKYEIVTYIS